MTKNEALDLALEALLWANIEINDWRDSAYGYEPEDQPQIMEAITAIKQVLAQPEERYTYGTPLLDAFTTPPAAQRQWVGLTDEDKLMCWARATHDADVEHKTEHQCLMDYGTEIEAKLKEKNT